MESSTPNVSEREKGEDQGMKAQDKDSSETMESTPREREAGESMQGIKSEQKDTGDRVNAEPEDTGSQDTGKEKE
jgi:hypothetical protein